jgi:ATP-dependent Lhr-like helicase
MLRLVENIEDSDPINWPKSLWQEIAETNAGIEAGMPIERVSHEAAETLDADLLERWRATARRNVPDELMDGWYSPSARGIKMRQQGLSMIPDSLRYRVRDAVTRSVIGSLDERFVLSISGAEDDDDAGLFVMAGRVWAVIDVDQEDSELLVSPGSAKADAPHWDGELPPVPKEIAHEVGRLRLAILDEIRTGPTDKSGPDDGLNPRNLAKGISAQGDQNSAIQVLDGEAYNRLANAVAEHYDAAECIPHANLFTIEQRADALVINTCQGSRINETLAHFLQAMGSTIEGRMGRALVDAFRVVLQVPGLDIGKAQEFLNNTPPSSIEGIMRVTVPNSRALRWRLAHVCRVMGVLRRGVDPRKVSLAGIIRRYRGTAVVDDALDKLFHERMDLDGCADVLRDIQSGVIEVRPSAPGPLGTSPRNRRDMLLPEFSDDEVLDRLEKRLLDERMVQICLRCSSLSRRRVARFVEAERRCTCGGMMLAAAVERGEKRLKDSIASTDEKERTRMIRNAELVRQYGLEAILCLVGRGIAENTAAKILRATPPKDRAALLRAIHKAEMQYARTRRFW